MVKKNTKTLCKVVIPRLEQTSLDLGTGIQDRKISTRKWVHQTRNTNYSPRRETSPEDDGIENGMEHEQEKSKEKEKEEVLKPDKLKEAGPELETKEVIIEQTQSVEGNGQAGKSDSTLEYLDLPIQPPPSSPHRSNLSDQELTPQKRTLPDHPYPHQYRLAKSPRSLDQTEKKKQEDQDHQFRFIHAPHLQTEPSSSQELPIKNGLCGDQIPNPHSSDLSLADLLNLRKKPTLKKKKNTTIATNKSSISGNLEDKPRQMRNKATADKAKPSTSRITSTENRIHLPSPSSSAIDLDTPRQNGTDTLSNSSSTIVAKKSVTRKKNTTSIKNRINKNQKGKGRKETNEDSDHSSSDSHGNQHKILEPKEINLGRNGSRRAGKSNYKLATLKAVLIPTQNHQKPSKLNNFKLKSKSKSKLNENQSDLNTSRNGKKNQNMNGSSTKVNQLDTMSTTNQQRNHRLSYFDDLDSFQFDEEIVI
ncbi:hypothetical protein Pst134EA_000250 [Puccinia striiformis f. sp. tritici]|uniref:hypothetical protein n=2 Tax=Puccinia striiformis f. sp. tritici TaxID=168172 RepID=UPI002008BECB|nr:hypothetical protein Pst134EA_000250 [Puccinia striiformis f. sp. tritici]KAH9473170.1 hypothetical protein Pst134EA_000250 [Puccinia striiformis f. sp. tritici]KAI9601506.1 hypothetical protein H4Q26_001326 [Puccinia striiformis f. sp. tritici PST-130]